jgi:hypothetical protein
MTGDDNDQGAGERRDDVDRHQTVADSDAHERRKPAHQQRLIDVTGLKVLTIGDVVQFVPKIPVVASNEHVGCERHPGECHQEFCRVGHGDLVAAALVQLVDFDDGHFREDPSLEAVILYRHEQEQGRLNLAEPSQKSTFETAPLNSDYGSSIWVLASETIPLRPPRFMVSTALEGTITRAPFSFNPSNSMFIARRCRAVGLSM